MARALAVEVIAEEAFAPIGQERVLQALQVLADCREVICTCPVFGPMNEGNRRLLQEAQAQGKPVRWEGESGHGL